MASSIVLESLSNRQLLGLLITNLILLIVIFVAGGNGPNPTSAKDRTMRACKDTFRNFDNFTRPIDSASCVTKIPDISVDDPTLLPDEVVYYVVFPSDHLPEITMSRWFQWMIGILTITPRQNQGEPVISARITYKAAIFGRDSVDSKWIPLRDQDPKDVYTRSIECDMEGLSCTDIGLFEMGSVYYKYYLVNLQLPSKEGRYNAKLPRISSVHIVEIHQNGGFTKLWITQKSIIFPVLVVGCTLFQRQVTRARSAPLLINRVIQWLGFVNVIVNVPLEYLSLMMDAPWLRLWYDCASGAFLAAMAVLWLLFIGEHRMDLDQRNKLSNYWKEITAITVCSLVMFLFDLIERGLQITDPFHSIWSSSSGESTARTLLIVSAVCACFYFSVLVYLMVRAVLSMSRKRSSLANVGRVRQLYYEGLISRFKVMVYTTVICGLLTLIMFILVNVNEMYYKFGRPEKQVNIGSGFLIGIAGLWNLYVLNILFLYAPTSTSTTPEDYETVEMNDVGGVASDAVVGPSTGLAVLTKPRAD